MYDVQENPDKVERAWLVGVQEGEMSAEEAAEHLDELVGSPGTELEFAL